MNPNFLSFWDGLFRMLFDCRIHYGKWVLGGYLGHSFLVYSEEQKSFSVEMTATLQASQKRVSLLNGYMEAKVFFQ